MNPKDISDQLEGIPFGIGDILIFTPPYMMGHGEARELRRELGLRFEWGGPLVIVSHGRVGDFLLIPQEMAEKLYQMLHAKFGGEGEEWKKGQT